MERYPIRTCRTSDLCCRLSRAELLKKLDNAIRWINDYPVDNAIGFPKIHKKLSGRWKVIYPVDRRYPTLKQMYEQMYGARAVRYSLPRVYTRRLVMFLLHNINSIYLTLAILKHPFCGKIRYFGRLRSLLLSIYFI